MEAIKQEIKEWKRTRDRCSWGSVAWAHARGVIHGLEKAHSLFPKDKSCPLYVDYNKSCQALKDHEYEKKTGKSALNQE